MRTATRSAHMLLSVVLLAGGLLAPRFSIALEPKKRPPQEQLKSEKRSSTPQQEPQRDEGGCRSDRDCADGSICWRPDHWSSWSCRSRR